MAFVINCVICSKTQDNKPLTPWRIVELDLKSTTFREFFHGPTMKRVFSDSEQKNELVEARIGDTKFECDFVDLDLKMFDAMGVFGRYVKFIVDDSQST